MLLVGVAVTGRAWCVSGGLFERGARRAMTHGSVVLKRIDQHKCHFNKMKSAHGASEAAFLKGEKLRQDKEELTSGRS